MPKYTVHYFEVKALGEGIRMLLAYGGQEFEDHRVTKEEWATLKSYTPFAQLPLLEIDGKIYAQSIAIARYLGRKYGLVGNDIEEDFEIDQNMDFYNDIRLKATSAFTKQDEELKAKTVEDFKANHYPAMLEKLNEIITTNNGHIAVGKLTWGDFVFAGYYNCLKMTLQIPDLDEMYPSFKNLQDNVLAIPRVKAYCDKAPKCDI